MEKVQKIGNNYVPLSVITTKIGSGATPRGGKESYKAEGISLIRSLNVHDFVFKFNDLARIDENQASKLKNVAVSAKDVLLNITGASVCRCCMVPFSVLPARVNQHVAIVRLNSEEADPHYVLYTINSKSFKNGLLNISMTGATREALTKSDIERFKIPLPDISTQRKIAAILTAYDDLIEINKRRIALLEKMAEELYREWFVRMRFPGHQNTQFVKGVPDGWKYNYINTLVDFQSGYSFKSEEYVPIGKFGVVTIKNVHDGTFIPNCSDYVDEVPSNIKYHCYLNRGDILLSLTGNVGRVCRVYGNNLLLNQRVAKLNPLMEHSRYYVYCFFKQPHLMTFSEMISTGAAQQNLSPIKLGNQKTVIPPAKLIERFELKTRQMFEQSTLLLEQNTLLTQTRNLLLPRLISGKLSVEDLDIQFPPSMQGD